MQTELIFSQGDFPANHSPLLESEREQMMNATCGAKCYEQYKRLNPHGSSQKMSLVLSILMADWFSSRCALTWKMKGTKFNRLLLQLQVKTHRTEETDAGSLLKTPTKMDGEVTSGKKNPTSGNSGTLAQEIMSGYVYQRGMLPTPNAFDWNTARKPETFEKAKQKHKEKGVNLQNPLKQMASMGMLPTPMATDSPEKNTGTRKQGSIAKIAKEMTGTTSQLNPRFVAEMMGFPPNWTELPFQSGETKA